MGHVGPRTIIPLILPYKRIHAAGSPLSSMGEIHEKSYDAFPGKLRPCLLRIKCLPAKLYFCKTHQGIKSAREGQVSAFRIRSEGLVPAKYLPFGRYSYDIVNDAHIRMALWRAYARLYFLLLVTCYHSAKNCLFMRRPGRHGVPIYSGGIALTCRRTKPIFPPHSFAHVSLRSQHVASRSLSLSHTLSLSLFSLSLFSLSVPIYRRETNVFR